MCFNGDPLLSNSALDGRVIHTVMLWRGCSVKRRSKNAFKAQLIPSFYVDFKAWVSYCASWQKSKPQFSSYSLTYVITNFSSSEKYFPSINLLMCPFPVVVVRLIRLTAQSHPHHCFTDNGEHKPVCQSTWNNEKTVIKNFSKTIHLFLSREENNKNLKLSINKEKK